MKRLALIVTVMLICTGCGRRTSIQTMDEVVTSTSMSASQDTTMGYAVTLYSGGNILMRFREKSMPPTNPSGFIMVHNEFGEECWITGTIVMNKTK